MIAAVPHVGMEQPGSRQVLAAHHDRRRLHDAALEQVRGQVERLVERDLRHFGVPERAIRIPAPSASRYKNDLGKAAQRFELQLDRGGPPLVVRVQKRDELVRPGADSRVPSGGHPRVGLTNVENAVREAPDDPRRVIRAAIVDHDDVATLGSRLVERALDGISQRVGAVVRWQHNRNAAVAGK